MKCSHHVQHFFHRHSHHPCTFSMAVYVIGIVIVGVFYVLVLGVGILAAWRKGLLHTGVRLEDLMLASRDIGLLLGACSLTGVLCYKQTLLKYLVPNKSLYRCNQY